MWRKRTHELLVIMSCALATAGMAGAVEGVIYVDAAATGVGDGSSWTNAYPYLQDALAAAAKAGEPLEIRVGQGTYNPDQGTGVTPGDRTIAFQLTNGVELRGGYAGVAGSDPNERDHTTFTTVLSGDLNDGDDPNVVNWSQYCLKSTGNGAADATVVLDGLRVTAGFEAGVLVEGTDLDLRNCTFQDNGYKALYGWNCHLSFTDCIVEGTGARVSGHHAIVCWVYPTSGSDYQPSYLKLKNCLFHDNSAGIYNVGEIALDDCSFTENAGQAVYCRGKLTARRCTFRANHGQGNVVECTEAYFWPGTVADCTLVDCEFIDNSSHSILSAGAVMADVDHFTATRCVFMGNSSNAGPRGAGAVRSEATVTRLSNCLFGGNRVLGDINRSNPGAVQTDGPFVQVSNCTFIGNRGKPNAINLDSGTRLKQCIVWDGPDAFQTGWVTFSNVLGGFYGKGNIDVGPGFVDPGYWDTNGTPDDLDDDYWVGGDYHLQSQAGHWDADSADWLYDDATSACIDAGDPNEPINGEPFPNDGYVNLGAYGATAEASRTYFGGPVYHTQIVGDINGDCTVNDLDMDILLSHWLMEGTGSVNTPPTVALISPSDGAEYSRGDPVVLQAEASDVDGTIMWIEYVQVIPSYGTLAGTTYSPTDNWSRQWNWWEINPEDTLIVRVWAKAVDNEGAVTISEPITITLHP